MPLIFLLLSRGREKGLSSSISRDEKKMEKRRVISFSRRKVLQLQTGEREKEKNKDHYYRLSSQGGGGEEEHSRLSRH